ncbi:hypothetical protein N7540_009949 [Penicillium herquei]|nr:hypothetical protein N7540_009949 [Penicillium herquei]
MVFNRRAEVEKTEGITWPVYHLVSKGLNGPGVAEPDEFTQPEVDKMWEIGLTVEKHISYVCIGGSVAREAQMKPGNGQRTGYGERERRSRVPIVAQTPLFKWAIG